MEITQDMRNEFIDKQIEKAELEKQKALLQNTMETERSRLSTELSNYIASMETSIDDIDKQIKSIFTEEAK